MNETQKTAIAILIVGAISASVAAQLHKYHQDLYARFPAIDRKIVRKAYRRFLLKAYSGRTGDLQDLTDEQMDVLFLAEVQNLQK